MRNDKLIPGMILVMIGATFLLNNFGYIHFHWSNLWGLWPIFLVMAGVNLLLASNKSTWAYILKITVIVGGFAIILFGNFDSRFRWWPRFHFHNNINNINVDTDDDDEESNDNDGKMVNVSGNSQFKEPYTSDIKIARLNLSGGATTYRLGDTTADLFKADIKEFRGKYQFSSHKQDSVYVMDFNMKDNHVWNFGNNNDDKNSAFISLNTRPEWEMHIEAGATDLNFDFSKFKMRDVTLKGGAGQFVLKMGQPLAVSNITVETGASDVTIEVPRDAACTIESSSGLSSNTFDGFTKKDNGRYETDNFASAKNKYYIHISGGVSDFKVHKY